MSGPVQVRLWNTLTAALEEFEPLDADAARREGRPVRVNMYVCGPTVYDDAHLGHARCYVTWDTLVRFLRFVGYDVVYVRNVTDVDDKILNRAKARGEAPVTLAERNYQRFREDMAALNVSPPTHEPRATAYIAEMQTGIRALLDRGAAYATDDGSVYFRVSAKPDYGKLKYATDDPARLRKHLDDLKAEARVETEPGKESPLDFALWKAVPGNDPNGWESPWPDRTVAGASGKGWGRPGWHMECSAMNYAVFGDRIDIHAGGADLIFPHHENEIAQSEAWTGKEPFARYWLHNGFVNVSGEKMSKSLGNFSTIKALLERYDANTIRYFLLTNGYRMPVDFNEEALESARDWWIRNKRRLNAAWQTAAAVPDLREVLEKDWPALSADNPELAAELDEFVRAMAQDMNTPQALGILNKLLKRIGSADARQPNGLAAACVMLSTLGFDLSEIGETTPAKTLSDGISDEVASLKELLLQRRQAKAQKDWPQADAIRKQLLELGFQLLDNKDGTTTLEKDGLEIIRA